MNRSYSIFLVVISTVLATTIAPVRKAQSQTTTEYTLIIGAMSLMSISTIAQIQIASEASLWNSKRSAQVLREKLYLRTYSDLDADTQEVIARLEAANASNTRINELRGELEALRGSIENDVMVRPGNTVGSTGQGVENLLNDDHVRLEYNSNLDSIRFNLAQALRILTEAESRGFCGDGICQSTESCLTCTVDCGIDQCTID